LVGYTYWLTETLKYNPKDVPSGGNTTKNEPLFDLTDCVYFDFIKMFIRKRRAISVQSSTGPYGFRRLRLLPEFLDNQYMKVVRLSAYAPAAFTPWYTFLLEAE
jgi:hypothetical protein